MKTSDLRVKNGCHPTDMKVCFWSSQDSPTIILLPECIRRRADSSKDRSLHRAIRWLYALPLADIVVTAKGQACRPFAWQSKVGPNGKMFSENPLPVRR